MDLLRLANIVGIGLQIVGVCTLAGSDLLARRIDAAYQSIPGNPLVDEFDAALKGSARAVTSEEMQYQHLQAMSDARKALRIFRASLILVIVGMLLQLVAAACNW